MIRVPTFTLSFGIPRIFTLRISLFPPVDCNLTRIEEKKFDPKRRRETPRESKSEPKTDNSTKAELERMALLIRANGWDVIEGNQEELEHFGLLPKSEKPSPDHPRVF